MDSATADATMAFRDTPSGLMGFRLLGAFQKQGLWVLECILLLLAPPQLSRYSAIGRAANRQVYFVCCYALGLCSAIRLKTLHGRPGGGCSGGMLLHGDADGGSAKQKRVRSRAEQQSGEGSNLYCLFILCAY